MNFSLPYGKSEIGITIDDSFHPYLLPEKGPKSLGSPENALLDKLRNPIHSKPLKKLAKAADRVGIIVNDITRPTPTAFILPFVLAELAHVKKENITFFIATGSHREGTPGELDQILGTGISSSYRVVQNNALDDSRYTHLGKGKFGNDILIHSGLLACDVLVSIGFIEPHFFAGFSGGMKNIMPGMAGMESIMSNHSAKMINDSKATWGITDGNPIWEEVNAVSDLFPKTFLINVTLNQNKEIDNIFCGDADLAHRTGCDYVKQASMVAVPHPFDVVITTNSGYPLDINLYQTVKGMSTAAQIVKPGGAIIVFSECPDGIPEHGCYRELLAGAESADDLLKQIYAFETPIPDQWQAQIQAKILRKAEVYLYSDNLTDSQIKACLLKPFRDFRKLLEGITAKKGSDLSICVAPRGPLTVPFID